MPYPTVDGPAAADSVPTAGRPPAESTSLSGRLMAVVAQDPFINLLVVAALGIGFFHGWLKLRFRSPITTFAYDIVLIMALVVVYLRAGSLGRFFPAGPTTKALMAFYGLCLAYLPFSLIPGMPPFWVALSTLRGWIFASLLFGLGYQIIRSRSQMHGYFLVILILAFLTALYGIRQTDAEVIQMMQEDPFFAKRYRGQGYLDAEGDFHVRRFSTFISSGAFGATMATTIILGCALFLAPATAMIERMVIVAMMVPIGYGMVLSGSRSAAIIAVAGCMILLAVRRKLLPSIVILSVILAGAALASQATGGGVLDRLGTLNFGNIFYRFWLPTYLGLEFMMGHPLGGGLGKTGFSPRFLINLSDYTDYLAPDGDLGRLMVEFGVLGLILFGWLSWNAAKLMLQTVAKTKDLPSGPLILAAATNLWISIAFVGVGSPFVGIPMGVLVWFFVGAALRLREIDTAEPGRAESLIRVTENSLAPGRIVPTRSRADSSPESGRAFLYRSRRVASVAPRLPVPVAPIDDGLSEAPAPAIPPSPPSKKVFLYGPATRRSKSTPGNPRSRDGSEKGTQR